MSLKKYSDSTKSGLGFAEVLTLIFVVLKLTNTIDWSWWWVLSPLWIGIAFIVAVLIILWIILLLLK